MSLKLYLMIGFIAYSTFVDLVGKYEVLTSVLIVSLVLCPALTSAGRYLSSRCWSMSEGSVPILVALKAEDLYVSCSFWRMDGV